ncbi:MAG: flagellar export protein FliJ [Treponema sp.]|nr:flagellar export protein FliJ [Treponema sp.]
MNKFSFELESVLEIRKFEEETAQSELAKALAVETGIQNNLNAVAAQYARTKESLKNNLDAQSYISSQQFFKVLDFQKEELLKKLAEAKMVSEQKRKNLLEKMQKVQALEKMKKIELEKYKNDLQREEDNDLDEINTIRYSADVLRTEE